MAKKKETKLPAKVQTTPQEVVLTEYGDYAGAGFEGTTQEDFSLPFIAVLQALSPQVSGSSAMENAKVGMLFNTVTEELFGGDEGFEFIPAHREQLYVEWVPRNQGGGFVGRHELGSDVIIAAKSNAPNQNELVTPVGNTLIQTAYIYGIIVHEDGRIESCVLAFTSTKLKKYRHLMTKLNQFTVQLPEGRKVIPPLFAHRLVVKTKSETNKKGDFMNFSITSAEETMKESLLSTKDERFMAAMALRDMIMQGKASANHDSQNNAGGEGTDSAPF